MSKALTGNAADEAQVKDAGQKERSKDERDADDLTLVMGTQAGRRVVKRLLDHANAFRSVYDDNPGRMAYNAGRQTEGHYWLAQINDACPGLYLLMMTEAAKESARG